MAGRSQPSLGPTHPRLCRVRALVLDIVRQLLAWPDLLQPANRPLLAALLGAFHDQGVQDVGAHGELGAVQQQAGRK